MTVPSGKLICPPTGFVILHFEVQWVYTVYRSLSRIMFPVPTIACSGSIHRFHRYSCYCLSLISSSLGASRRLFRDCGISWVSSLRRNGLIKFVCRAHVDSRGPDQFAYMSTPCLSSAPLIVSLCRWTATIQMPYFILYIRKHYHIQTVHQVHFITFLACVKFLAGWQWSQAVWSCRGLHFLLRPGCPNN